MILYQNDFEHPAQDPPQLSSCAPDFSQTSVNDLYGAQGAAFQQVNTVETILIHGQANQYSDPLGTGGNYAIGMLCCVQDDKVALTFDSQGKPYLSLKMNISAIDVNGCGGPFGVAMPTFRMTLYDTPSGTFDFHAPGTVLSTVDLVGNAPGAASYTFNWKTVVAALSTAGSVNGRVTVVWDLLPGSGYASFDNLTIAASTVPGETVSLEAPIPTLQEWALGLMGLLLGGLVWRQSRRTGQIST